MHEIFFPVGHDLKEKDTELYNEHVVNLRHVPLSTCNKHDEVNRKCYKLINSNW